MMNMIQFMGAMEMGLVYSLVALAVYLSFRTLQFPDLTVDGSFPLGAAVCAALITSGVDPAWATLLAIGAGALSGLVTAWLSTHLKVLNLLAGILTMTALYSINLRVMGRPNVALFGEKTIFTEYFFWMPSLSSAHFLPILTMTLFTGLGLFWFLRTRMGLGMRAIGSNDRMGRAQGIDDHKMIWLGLALSNALAAFGGALFAQFQGFADVTMGVGTIVIGLAAVIIGESILSIRTISQALVACFLGALAHRLVMTMALNTTQLGLKTSDNNLVTAVLVALAILFPILKRRFKDM